MGRSIILVILSLVWLSCEGPRQDEELKKSYELTISLLTVRIKQNGNIIRYARGNHPTQMERYYNYWLTIDSLFREIETFKTDSLDNISIPEFYVSTTNRIKETQSNYFTIVFGKGTGRAEKHRIEHEERLAKYMTYPNSRLVKEATFPKLFACVTLLENLQTLSKLIVRDISSSEYIVRIPWDGLSEVSGDTTAISITSKEFYNLTKDGIINIDKVMNSRMQVVKPFDSEADDVIWTVTIPNQTDSVYYLTGSILARHPMTGEINEIDTFLNRKITTANK